MMKWTLLFFLLLTPSVRASDIAIYDYEAVDDNSSANSRGSLELTKNFTGSGSSRFFLVKDLIRNASNGGHSTSHWSAYAKLASGELGVWRMPRNAACTASGTPFPCCTGSTTGNCPESGISLGVAAAGVALHLGSTAPSNAAGRSFLQFLLADGTVGCYPAVNSDGTISLYYRSCTSNGDCGGSTCTIPSGNGIGYCLKFGTHTSEILTQGFCEDSSAGTCTGPSDSSCGSRGKCLGVCTAGYTGRYCESTGDCGAGGTCDFRCRGVFSQCVTASADCPTSQQCSTCSTSNGTGCYFPFIEIAQTNATSPISPGTLDTVECDIIVNGKRAINTSPQTVPGGAVSPIVGINWGFGLAETSSVELWWDSSVLTDSNRTNISVIGTAVPASNGRTDWPKSLSTCTGGFDCYDDYGKGICASSGDCEGSGNTCTNNLCTKAWTYNQADDGVKVQRASKVQEITSFTPSLTYPIGTISTVEGVLLGLTNSTIGGDPTSRELAGTLLVCATPGTSASCVPAIGGEGNELVTTLIQNGMTTDFSLLRLPTTYVPGTVDNPGAWDSTSLQNVGMRFKSTANYSTTTITRASAALVYARWALPDSAASSTPNNLKDRNGDGKIIVEIAGDSNTGGTFSGSCPAGPNVGDLCSINGYCSWDAGIGQDKPTGGCLKAHSPTIGCNYANPCAAGQTCINCPISGCPSLGGRCFDLQDAMCKTCDNTRFNSPTGAGYQCDGSHLCTNGTCDSALLTCTQNSNIPCDDGAGNPVDSKCQNLGSCSSSATCVPSCPEGQPGSPGTPGYNGGCPVPTTWGSFVAQSLSSKVNSFIICPVGTEGTVPFRARAVAVLNGRDANCGLVNGETGKCTCVTTADCSGSDTCVSGLCTGTGLSGNCRGHNNCASDVCAWPAPDYFIYPSGAGDFLGNPNDFDPDCATNTPGIQYDPCNNCPTHVCTVDANCTGRAADSFCIGGLCSCPCDSTDMTGWPNAGNCNSDLDCPVTWEISQQITTIDRGVCNTSTHKCGCCGVQPCGDAGVPCAQNHAAWQSARGDSVVLTNKYIEDLAFSLFGANAPLILHITEADYPVGSCSSSGALAFGALTENMAAADTGIMHQFNHTLDVRKVLEGGNYGSGIGSFFGDAVHFNIAGARRIAYGVDGAADGLGGGVEDLFNCINTCCRTSDYYLAPQRFCKTNTGWGSPCTSSNDCSAGTCQLRICGCTSDGDCASNGGGTCINGGCSNACKTCSGDPDCANNGGGSCSGGLCPSPVVTCVTDSQ